MTTSTVRATTSALPSVIPSLLGYRPARSLVCLALDSTSRIVFAARVDLPTTTAEVPAWQVELQQITDAGKRHEIASILPVLWDEHDEVDPEVAGHAMRAARQAFSVAQDTASVWIGAQRVRVQDAHESAERERVNDPAGDLLRLVRHEQTGGMVEFDSREAVEDTLRAGDPLPHWPEHLGTPYDAPTAVMVWLAVMRAQTPHGEEVANLVATMEQDPNVRDAIAVAWIGAPAMSDSEVLPEHPGVLALLSDASPRTREERAAAWQRLARIIRGIPRGHSADLSALAAVLGARIGQDCLTVAACERALQDNPRHRLTLLLTQAQRYGMLRQLITTT